MATATPPALNRNSAKDSRNDTMSAAARWCGSLRSTRKAREVCGSEAMSAALRAARVAARDSMGANDEPRDILSHTAMRPRVRSNSQGLIRTAREMVQRYSRLFAPPPPCSQRINARGNVT